MRDLDAEHLTARVGVRVEMHETEGTVTRRAGADVRLRDRVIASEDDRNQAGVENVADGRLDRRV